MALVQKQFGDLITFTRSSAGGRFNERGLFEMVPANQPRFNYDPVTRQPLGLLVEEPRTNLMVRSESLGVSPWSKRGDCVVSTGGPSSPKGGGPGQYIQGLGNAGVSDIYQATHSLIPGTRYEPSVFMARGVSSGIVSLQNTSNMLSGRWLVDLSKLSSSYQRITRTHPAVSVVTEFVGHSDSASGIHLRRESGDSALDIYVWGFQLELGNFSTTYIPTEASQVTRTADVAMISQLSPWYNTAGGTLLISVTPLAVDLAIQKQFVCLDDGTLNNRMEVSQSAGTSNTVRCQAVSGLSIVADISTGKLAWGIKAKIAFTYESGKHSLTVNGAPPIVNNSPGMALGFSKLIIGSRSQSGSTQNCLLESIRYYPRRLTDAELQELTK